MLENLPKFHTLDIEYNGFGPFTAVSNERAGIIITLGVHTVTGAFGLYLNYRIDKNTSKHYVLDYLQPGDRLKFTYDGPNTDSGTSIDHIEEHDRPEPIPIGDGLRFGFDVIEGERRTRLSYPEGGGMHLTIVNSPLDHARVWVSAGNDQEDWRWQLKDLYAGDSFEIEIVETDWCDTFPHVTKNPVAQTEDRE
jgi:hypothetical protein